MYKSSMPFIFTIFLPLDYMALHFVMLYVGLHCGIDPVQQPSHRIWVDSQFDYTSLNLV